jgi:hypothetical protein
VTRVGNVRRAPLDRNPRYAAGHPPGSFPMPVALLIAFLAACHHDETDAIGELGSCDPLDPAMCALPYPSSFFLREADTETGYQVHFADDSLPTNRDGVQMQPTYMNEKDGFSTLGPLLTWFDDLSLDGVVGHENLADYAADDAKIVLVDTVTGDRVPVWAELDMTAEDPGQRLFYIWPAVPLEHARRYVVGIRGLVTNAGAPVPSSTAFAALRDGTETDDPNVELRRDGFDSTVFPALEGAGVPRSDLILAWDFVTLSRASSLGRMEFMRDDGLARLPAGGPTYEITDVEDHDCSVDGPIARDIRLTMTVPLYTVDDGANTILTRDEHGMPFYNGDTQPSVLVRIPCSVAEDPHPAPVLQYGHGLLGTKDEAYTGWLSNFANDNGYIILASTWTGMSTEDVPAISLAMVQDPTNFAIVPERSHQGMFETLAALKLVMGDFADDDVVTYGGIHVIDKTKHVYYGNSQGGIMGGAYLAMSPDLDRGILGVPGMPYSLLLDRSHDFDPFFDLFKAKFLDHRDISFCIETFEALWEPAEAGGWAYDMNRDVADGMQAKQVLIQSGLGDAQVTTLGAEMMARAYGAKTISPQTQPIFGVEEGPASFTGSGIVEFTWSDVLPMPVTNTPPDLEHDPHECPRREPAGQQQAAEFLETGVITNHCDGVCDDHTQAEICGG